MYCFLSTAPIEFRFQPAHSTTMADFGLVHISSYRRRVLITKLTTVDPSFMEAKGI